MMLAAPSSGTAELDPDIAVATNGGKAGELIALGIELVGLRNGPTSAPSTRATALKWTNKVARLIAGTK